MKMEVSLSVNRKPAEMIVPAGPTPKETKQLSVIDTQKELWSHYPIIMFYQSNALMEGKDPVKVIKEAVAKVLVYYYPYAGRVIKLEEPDHNDQLLVECNSQGVLFVEADAADIRLNDLGDSIRPPCPYSDDLLYDVPISGGIFGHPILLIQVTRFKCGGFAFGVRWCHVISDGLGLAQFLNAVGEMARGAIAPSILPVWERELIYARNPPNVTCEHPEYEEDVDQDPLVTMNEKELVQRSFFFGPNEMRAIRKHMPQRCSTFDRITACVWKLRTKSLQVDPDQVVRLTSVMSVRSKDHLDLPGGFYGNAMASPAAVTKAGDLCMNSLDYALGLMKEAKAKVNEEFLRSLIDLMVVEGGPPLAKSWNFLVSDNSRLRFEEVDCGWGKAVYGGPVVGGTSCWSFYVKFRNNKGEDGILVPIWLPFPAMERFEEELKTLMQPVHITSML